jgi:hypothetical protein
MRTLLGSGLMIAALPRCGQAKKAVPGHWLDTCPFPDVGRLELTLPEHGQVKVVSPGCGQARTGPTWTWASYSCLTWMRAG